MVLDIPHVDACESGQEGRHAARRRPVRQLQPARLQLLAARGGGLLRSGVARDDVCHHSLRMRELALVLAALAIWH